MPKIVNSPDNMAIAKTVSLEAWEWEELERLAIKWRVSRSKALRRIWNEWDAGQAAPVSAPAFVITGGKEDAVIWEQVKKVFQGLEVREAA